MTSGPSTDISPAFSPDGRKLAFLRDRKELRVIDLNTRAEHAAATGVFGDPVDPPKPAWSPDGKWIALFAIGAKAFKNVVLVAAESAAPPAGRPAAPGAPRPVSFLANAYTNTVVWSRDGTYLLFHTRQQTGDGRLARVDLTLRTPKFREELFRDSFTEPTPPTAPRPEAAPDPKAPAAPEGPKAPVSPVFDDIRRRLSFIPVGVDVGDVAISPDGKTAVVIGAAVGRTNLYSYSLDELSPDRPVARQLTTSAGAKSHPQFSPDSKEVYCLDAGRISIVTLDRREARPLTVAAELTVDFAAEKLQIFRQAWTMMRDNFFDRAFNGVDWAAQRTSFEPRIAAAGTPDEMRRLMSLMVGDLNSSHLGVTAPGPATPVVGRLGLWFDARKIETSGRLRITDVVPLGPAALTRAVAAGDYLEAVDGRAIGPGVSLDELLSNTIDRRVVLTIAPAAGGAARELVVRPTNQATEKGLLYRQWVERNRAYVDRISGGRLGYVHMINMSAAALDQLFIDLDADNHARDGVVVDIRNNTGGFVNAYAIDVFARQLESPTVLVTNQHSLSGAEDFSDRYRRLKLGPIVGEPTAGWIIYTWDARLFDGTTFRLPRMRVRAADGTNLKGHPRAVDVPVTRPIGETLMGKDSQLDQAVRTLLKTLGRAE